ncbi:hypothetical protein Metli_0385 [Methanofollis liminatans DSM 4140]|jgi:hypothetical protein|uniref:Uncharacterized protein n=1 Tax=Methanofollis liminatans DSM 4140 TaxID=28892 RepID=J1ANE5_9EURY|nr:hypothetical protein [Methanofollis liminatans]EJG06353.1 hypothetical protein Metli_0385 [Methanofollis liminatans DSM 4140]
MEYNHANMGGEVVGHRRQAHLIGMDLPAIFIFSGVVIAPGITTCRRTPE